MSRFEPRGICDICGWEYPLSKLQKNWRGLMVCSKDYEERHPQDLLRPVRESQGIANARPEPPPLYTGNSCTGEGRSGKVGYGVVGCMIIGSLVSF